MDAGAVANVMRSHSGEVTDDLFLTPRVSQYLAGPPLRAWQGGWFRE